MGRAALSLTAGIWPRVGQMCGPRSDILEQSEDAEGCTFVTCSLDSSTDADSQDVRVDCLVLTAWWPGGHRRGLSVKHFDGLRKNNWLYSLRWVAASKQAPSQSTASEQALHKTTASEPALNTARTGTSRVPSECINSP